jgi:hypothetical protein
MHSPKGSRVCQVCNLIFGLPGVEHSLEAGYAVIGLTSLLVVPVCRVFCSCLAAREKSP